MGLSTYQSGALLAASAWPYVALLVAMPEPGDTGSELQEPAYTGYERIVVPNPPGWSADATQSFLTAPQLQIPEYQSGPTPTIIGWATCDEPTGGHWGWSGLCTPFVVDAEDPAPVWGPGVVILNLAAQP